MFTGNAMPSLADIAAVTKNDDGTFGGNGAWWIIILVLIFFGGWGGYGYGAPAAATAAGVADNYALASDFSMLSRQIDTGFTNTNGLITNSSDALQRQITAVGNGISSLGYDQLAQINGVNTNISNGVNTLQSAINSCCCNTQQNVKDTQYLISTNASEISRGVERGFADTNYNLATQANGITNAITSGFCQTNYNAQTNTRDIVDSQNANTRAILDKLCQMETDAKDNKIAELTAMNSDLRLAASQQAQNNYLVSQLGQKSPIPAYVVANPYCNCGTCCSGCGC